MTAQEIAVRDDLQALAQRIETCMDALDARPLSGERRAWAREEYGAIKARLRAEYRRTQRDEDRLNDAERAFYAPCIHEAYVKLEPPTNSTDLAAIRNALDDALIDLDHTLTGLRSLEPESPEEAP